MNYKTGEIIRLLFLHLLESMKRVQQSYKSYIALLLLACLCYSCEEVFEIDSRDISNAIAFEGVITNEPPPYFFRLTHVVPLGGLEDGGVVDAQIVITDHTAGLKDTLKLITPIRFEGLTRFPYYNYHIKKSQTIYYNSSKANGIYVTTKIYGIENHQYSLDILYRGKHHTADETMVPKTPITAMTVKNVDLGEKGESWAPCISFVNRPGEENYYLFKVDTYSTKSIRIANLFNFFSGAHYWPYSVLSDEHLNENVEEFIVSEGEQGFGLPGASYPLGSDSLFVCIQSISKACYESYGDMIEQIRNDGGAYTPRPVSVRGNISGGAFGLFRVSAISERYVLLERS